MSKKTSKKSEPENPLGEVAVRNDAQSLMYFFAFWGLAALLFFPPYFRGLFFATDQQRALILAAVVFWFAWQWKLLRRDTSFLTHRLDYFILAFPAVYLLSAFGAVNYSLAVDDIVKTVLYFLIYWMVVQVAGKEKDIVDILKVIYLSAVGVALGGLATATGIIHIKAGFIIGRICSTFQYPNTLASFLAALTFLGLYLWWVNSTQVRADTGPAQPRPSGRYLYAAGNFLLFMALLGTKSNGGLLVFAVILVLYMIGLPQGKRLPVATHFVFISVPAFIAIWRFLPAVGAEQMALAWLWVLAGLAMVALGQLTYDFLDKRSFFNWIAGNKRVILGGLLILLVLALAGLVFYLVAHSSELRERISGEIRVRNAIERSYFFKDAVKMFLDRPLLGWGGGAWKEAFRYFQSYLYNSTQVHGHYFQVAVEVGLIGLFVIIGIWVNFLLAAGRILRNARNNPERRMLAWVILIIALALGLHAAIDFDLTFGSIAIILWTMFGLMRSMEPAKTSGSTANYRLLRVVTSLVSAVIILFAGTLSVSNFFSQQARSYLMTGSYDNALTSLQIAGVANPFNADVNSVLARVYYGQGRLAEGLAEAQEAVRKSKYNPQRYNDLAVLYFSSGDFANTVASAEKVADLAPFLIRSYEEMISFYDKAAMEELKAGNLDAAREYFQRAVAVPQRITDKMESVSDREKKLWNVAPLMEVTPSIHLRVGVAQYFLGNWPEAEAELLAARRDERMQVDALMWLSILKNKQGKIAEAGELLAEGEKLVPQIVYGYDAYKELPVLKQ